MESSLNSYLCSSSQSSWIQMKLPMADSCWCIRIGIALFSCKGVNKKMYVRDRSELHFHAIERRGFSLMYSTLLLHMECR